MNAEQLRGRSSMTSEKLRAALEWAMKRLDPYSHEPECSPTHCVCGFAEARAALNWDRAHNHDYTNCLACLNAEAAIQEPHSRDST